MKRSSCPAGDTAVPAEWRCRNAGKIGIGAVDHRLVEARPGDARLEIVAHRLSARRQKKKMRARAASIQSGRRCVKVASA